MAGTILQRQGTEAALSGLTIVMPAYKEDETYLTQTYKELTSLGAEVIIVDDGNTMDLEIPHETYPANMGYGYAIKHGIKKASNETILTMDSDAQHQVKDAIILYKIYQMIDGCEMVVGQRWSLKENPIRYIARKFLNFLASIISGHYMVDLNSGMRVFDRKLALGYSPILCDTFSFTTSLTMSMVTDGHKFTYIPIDVLPRNTGKSRVKLFRDGLVTLYYIVWVGLALRTRRLRACLKRH